MSLKRVQEVNRMIIALESLANTIDPSANVKFRYFAKNGDEWLVANIRKGEYKIMITADSPAAIVKDVIDNIIYKI
jgi:hypothetical protein